MLVAFVKFAPPVTIAASAGRLPLIVPMVEGRACMDRLAVLTGTSPS